MIHVVAIITTKPGKRAEFLAAYTANIPLVRAEPGCIEYGPKTDAPDSPAPLGEDAFVVIGKWESMRHIQAHMKAPHMPAFWEKTRDLWESRAVHFLQAA